LYLDIRFFELDDEFILFSIFLIEKDSDFDNCDGDDCDVDDVDDVDDDDDDDDKGNISINEFLGFDNKFCLSFINIVFGRVKLL
jgi:hypothetical protein